MKSGVFRLLLKALQSQLHLPFLASPFITSWTLSLLQLFPSPCCYHWKISPSVPPLWSLFCFREGCLHLHFLLLILRFSRLTPSQIVPSSKLWMAAYFADFHGFNLGFLEFPDTHKKWWFYFSMSLTIKQYLKCKPCERQSHKIRLFLVLFKCFLGVLSECSNFSIPSLLGLNWGVTKWLFACVLLSFAYRSFYTPLDFWTLWEKISHLHFLCGTWHCSQMR